VARWARLFLLRGRVAKVGRSGCRGGLAGGPVRPQWHSDSEGSTGDPRVATDLLRLASSCSRRVGSASGLPVKSARVWGRRGADEERASTPGDEGVDRLAVEGIVPRQAGRGLLDVLFRGKTLCMQLGQGDVPISRGRVRGLSLPVRSSQASPGQLFYARMQLEIGCPVVPTAAPLRRQDWRFAGIGACFWARASCGPAETKRVPLAAGPLKAGQSSRRSPAKPTPRRDRAPTDLPPRGEKGARHPLCCGSGKCSSNVQPLAVPPPKIREVGE
jgi:hypothetical protein